MNYLPLPPNTNLSSSQFIVEMNKALKSLPEYKAGMVICADDSGYWLELLGVKNIENDDLLSIVHNLTLVAKNKI